MKNWSPLIILSLVVSCRGERPIGTGDGSADSAADMGVAADGPSPDTTGDTEAEGGTSQCCPIETPSCDCFVVGGKRRSADPFFGCQRHCDAVPMGWRMSVDESGCPILVKDQPGRSCLDNLVRDARPEVPVDMQGDMSVDGAGDVSVDERD